MKNRLFAPAFRVSYFSVRPGRELDSLEMLENDAISNSVFFDCKAMFITTKHLSNNSYYFFLPA
jgi:hypothetical protein